MRLKYTIILLLSLGISTCLTAQQRWMTGWEKPAQNPILKSDSTYTFHCPIKNSAVRWQKADVFNPGAIVRNDSVFILFRAEDNPKAFIGGRTSRIGLAYSTDGLNFTKHPEPVLFPENDEFKTWDFPGGVEDPRVVELAEGGYVMLYTSWDSKTARLSSAYSRDLRKWIKSGPVFQQAHEGRFLDIWSKSGSIITELKGGRLIAKKFNGKYLMYWGELMVNLAESEDGLQWKPLLDENGELLQVFKPKVNTFYSHLTEPGPPALFTEEGIVLFYNAKNLSGEGATDMVPEGTYCGALALFSPDEPARLLNVMDEPFICPSLPHEVTGQYKAGTTFIQGLVFYKDKWYLYYGTADSMVGVAVRDGL